MVGLFQVVRGKVGLMGAIRQFFSSREGARWGLFFGLLLAIFNGSMHISRRRNRAKPTPIPVSSAVPSRLPTTLAPLLDGIVDRIVLIFPPELLNQMEYYRGYIGGALAGLSILALPQGTRSTVAIFIAVRALEIQAKLAVRRGFIPHIPNADTILIALASAEVMWAWVFRSDSIERGYRGFLLRHGQLHNSQVEGVHSLQLGLPMDMSAINKYRERIGLAAVADPEIYAKAGGWAELMHPGKSFLPHTSNFFISAFRLALSVYVPVYAMSLAVYSPTRLLKRPIPTIQRLVTDACRSALFLSVYTTSGIASMTLWRHFGFTHRLMGDFSQVMVALAGATGGVGLLIEKPSRRIELALFVCRQAVHSLFQLMHASPLLQGPIASAVRSRLDVIIFCVGVGHIMHAFIQHPQLNRYQSLLSRFFDTPDCRNDLFGNRVGTVSERSPDSRRRVQHDHTE